MRNFFGLIVVLLGIGFLLQQLNVPGADALVRSWWPLVIVIIGLGMWNANRQHVFGPLVIVLVGVIALLDQWNIFHQSAWNLFWPVVVIIIGIRIFFGRSWEKMGRNMTTDVGSAQAEVIFSGIDRKVTGIVTNGSLSAWFGGVKMDLREAQFTQDVTLNISAGFGGIELYVPKSVKVVNQVNGILGGSEDKTSADTSAPHTLTLKGSCMFGGLTVRN